jgi:hypothetical protein
MENFQKFIFFYERMKKRKQNKQDLTARAIHEVLTTKKQTFQVSITLLLYFLYFLVIFAFGDYYFVGEFCLFLCVLLKWIKHVL